MDTLDIHYIEWTQKQLQINADVTLWLLHLHLSFVKKLFAHKFTKSCSHTNKICEQDKIDINLYQFFKVIIYHSCVYRMLHCSQEAKKNESNNAGLK